MVSAANLPEMQSGLNEFMEATQQLELELA